MKPAFALHLDHDRITLLHRSGSEWVRIGAADPADADLDAALAGLRLSARGIETGSLTCKLILPASQILYREVFAPGPDARSRKQQIRAALKGMTPYDVDDLVFDWSGTGESVQIAVVARETLDEAEEFAVRHRFGPVSFVASPDPGQFAGEPFFGQTRIAGQLLPGDERVMRDNEPVRVTAPSEQAAADVDPPALPQHADNAPDAAPEKGGADTVGTEPVGPGQALPGPATDLSPEKAVTSDRIDTSAPTAPTPEGSAVALPHDLAANPVGISEPLPPERAETGAEGTAQTEAADAPHPADGPPGPPPYQAPTAAQIAARVAAWEPGAAPHAASADPEADSISPAGPWRVSAQRLAVAGLIALFLGLGVVWSLESWHQAKVDVAVHADPADVRPVRPDAQPGRADRAADMSTGAQEVPAPDGATTPKAAAKQSAAKQAATTPVAATLVARAPSVTTDPPRRDGAATGTVADAADDVTDRGVFRDTLRDATTVTPARLAQTAHDGLPRIGQIAARPAPTSPGTRAANAPASDALAPDSPVVEIRDSAPLQPVPAGSQSAASVRVAALDLQLDRDRMLTIGRDGLIRPGTRDAVPDPVLSQPAPLEPAGAEVSGADVAENGLTDGTEGAVNDPALAGFRPRARPEGLAPPPPDLVISDLAPAEAAPRPRARPQPVIDDLAAEAAASAAAKSAAASATALAASREPAERPQTFAAIQGPQAAAPAGPNIEADAEPEVTRRAPRIPTSASVAKRATVKDGITMRDINLIGVFGSSGDRRALVRMPNGNMLRVRVGDRIDGGRVAVIDQSRLIYVKGSRNHVLEIPKG